MKSWFRWSVLALALAGLADGFYAYHYYFSRDGSAPRKAIIVPSGLGDREVDWEMREARRLHPDADLGNADQALLSYKGRVLDAWGFQTSGGKQIDVYFDIGPDKTPSGLTNR